MDLTIVPRRNPAQRDVVSNTLRDASDEPVVCYEIVDAPGIFTTESTSVKRVHEPVVRAKEDWQRPTTVVVRWGILRETTLNYVGGKERLPVRLKDYLKKPNRNGEWIREFTARDRAQYQWRLENNTHMRLYHKESGKRVASYDRGERPEPNARRVTRRRPQLHVTDLGLHIVDDIVLTWTILEPISRGRGVSFLLALRRL